MPLPVMTLFGLLILALGCMIFWLLPVTTSQPKSVKPIGTSAVSHGGSSSADQPRTRMDHSDPGASREELDMQRR